MEAQYAFFKKRKSGMYTLFSRKAGGRSQTNELMFKNIISITPKLKEFYIT